ADHVRRQRQDADDDDHRRGRPPYAELGSRAVLPGAEAAQDRHGAGAHSRRVARDQHATEQHARAGPQHDRLVRAASRDPDGRRHGAEMRRLHMRRLTLAAALAFCASAVAAPYTAKVPLPVATVFQPGVISTADDESHPTFSADGTTL